MATFIYDGAEPYAAVMRKRREAAEAPSINPLLAPIGAIDTIGNSIGLLDDTSVQRFLGKVVGQSTADSYSAHKIGYRAVGDIGTLFLGVGAINKAIKAGSLLEKGLSKLGTTGRLLSSTIITDQAVVDASVSAYAKLAGQIGSTYGATTLRGVEATDKLRKLARVKTLTNSLKEGVAAEAFVYGAMNASPLVGTEGMSGSDIAIWSAGGMAFSTGVNQLWLGKAVKLAGAALGEAAGQSNQPFIGHNGLDFVSAMANNQKLDNAGTGLLSESPSLQGSISSIRSSNNSMLRSSVSGLITSDTTIPTLGDASKAFGGLESDIVESLQGVVKQDTRLVANTFSIVPISRATEFEKSRQAIAEVAKVTGTAKPAVIHDIEEGIQTYAVDTLGQVKPIPEKLTLFDVPKPSVTRVGKGEEAVYIATGKGVETNKKVAFSLKGKVLYNGKPLGNATTLSPMESSQIYTAMSKAVSSAVSRINSKKVLPIAEKVAVTINSRLETLDYAIAIAERVDGDLSRVGKVIDVGAFKTFEDLKYAGLNAKYQRYRSMVRENQKALVVGRDPVYNLDNAGSILMLKQDSIHGENAAQQWFSSLAETNAKSIGDTYESALDDFLKHYFMETPEGIPLSKSKEFVEQAEGLLYLPYANKLSDRSVAYAGVYRKSNIASTHEYNFSSIKEAARLREEIRQSELTEALKADPNAAIVAELDQAMAEVEVLAKAQSKGAEALTQEASSLPLFPKQGQLGIETLDFTMRNVSGSSANSALGDIAFRKINHRAKQMMASGLTKVKKMLDNGNETSLLKYLHYHSAKQQGWRLASDVADSNGRFLLDQKSKVNRKIVKQVLGDSKHIPKYLPDPMDTSLTTALTMDELSLAALNEMMGFSKVFHSVDDILSKSLGGVGVQKFIGHTIEPLRYGQEMVFITDARGSVVDYAFGVSQSAARKEAVRRLEARVKAGSGPLGLVDRTDVRAYKEAMREAWNGHIVDVSKSWQHTAGRKARGARQGLIVSKEYVQAQLKAIESNFQDMGSKYMATKFAGQITNVRSMQQAANITTTNALGQKVFSDVYDKWVEQLTNTSNKNIGSLYGSLGGKVEDAFNNTVAKALDVIDGITGSSGRLDKNIEIAAKKLAKETGYNPVKYAMDLADRQVGRALPKTASTLLRSASNAVMVMSLKLFEVGHAALTYSSILTTTPHAVRWFKRLNGETDVQMKQRLQHMADILPDGSVIPNSTALTLSVMAKKMRGDYTDVLREAKELGYVDSAMAEFINDLVNPSYTKGGKALKAMIDASGKIPVHSEEYARTIAFLTGYELFRVAGKQPKRLSMALANDLANKAIADYRPHQRSQPFKGSAGVPLAMFQTFSINYFQRLVTAVENKAWGAVFTQAATQQFMFGSQGMPGYDVFNEVILGNWDSTRRVEDNFDMEKNPLLGSFLKYGFVSTLPMLLGAEDGLALYTRGSMQVPTIPTPLNYGNTPLGNTVERLYTGMSTAVQALANSPDSGGLRVAREALVYSIPNRPIRSMLETIQGSSVDKYGNVVDKEINSVVTAISAFTGIRTNTRQRQIEMLYRDSRTALAHRNAMSGLKRNVVTSMKSIGVGKYTDAHLESVLEKYFASGGSAKGFRSWYRSAAAKAQYSKFDRKVMEIFNSEGASQKYADFASIADSVE